MKQEKEQPSLKDLWMPYLFVEMKPFYKGDVLVMNSISLINKNQRTFKKLFRNQFVFG